MDDEFCYQYGGNQKSSTAGLRQDGTFVTVDDLKKKIVANVYYKYQERNLI